MRHVIGLVLVLSLAACAQPAAKGDPVAEVRAADVAISKAVSAKNLDAVMVHYADDAVMLPMAEPMIEGKVAIRAEWEHILAIPDMASTTTLRDANVSTAGDMAYTYGTYRARMMGEDGKSVEEPGKFVSIWKKQPDGQWRIVVDTYNTDVPPPDHK